MRTSSVGAGIAPSAPIDEEAVAERHHRAAALRRRRRRLAVGRQRRHAVALRRLDVVERRGRCRGRGDRAIRCASRPWRARRRASGASAGTRRSCAACPSIASSALFIASPTLSAIVIHMRIALIDRLDPPERRAAPSRPGRASDTAACVGGGNGGRAVSAVFRPTPCWQCARYHVGRSAATSAVVPSICHACQRGGGARLAPPALRDAVEAERHVRGLGRDRPGVRPLAARCA